ncbi:MAG: zinc-dependent alcohol dehydrogenase family protein, partial [Kiloniellales bacterium]|nr:zinc-dependent alcohol dehydrogenase family protein [Kiloniellales bacterium]
MRAAIFESFRAPLQIAEVPDPDCPPDGAIIDVKACGVCRSDWHAWSGADPDVVAPHVPGHEFSGLVLEVGPKCNRFKPGDRVTAPFIVACGSCSDCLGGDATLCDDQHIIGFSSWGAFAEYVAIPHADFNLVPLPEILDFVPAAGLGCRVTTAYRGLVERAQLQPGEWLAVHGCGGIGLAATMIASALGASVIAIDIKDDALEIAARLGATKTLNATGLNDVGSAVRDLTKGGAQVSVDALGVTETLLNSLASLDKLGRHVQIGMPTGSHAEPKIPILDLVYARQLTIHGTRGLAASRFPKLFQMIESGRLDPSRLVTKTIALEAAGNAMAEMDKF